MRQISSAFDHCTSVGTTVVAARTTGSGDLNSSPIMSSEKVVNYWPQTVSRIHMDMHTTNPHEHFPSKGRASVCWANLLSSCQATERLVTARQTHLVAARSAIARRALAGNSGVVPTRVPVDIQVLIIRWRPGGSSQRIFLIFISDQNLPQEQNPPPPFLGWKKK